MLMFDQFATFFRMFLSLAVILTIGFLMSTAGMLGAGDAKFAAAMAPFFPLADASFVLARFWAAILAALVGSG